MQIGERQSLPCGSGNMYEKGRPSSSHPHRMLKGYLPRKKSAYHLNEYMVSDESQRPDLMEFFFIIRCSISI